jgi:uncharacterized protein
MTTMNTIQDFLSQDRIAVVGVSAKGEGFGTTAYKELKARGFNLIPVHPTANQIFADQAYPSLRELPAPVGAVLIIVPPGETEKVVEEAIEAGIRHIWMQQGAESERAIELCRRADIDFVAKECVLMFACSNRFPHNIHHFINKVFGKLPAEESAA